MSAQSARSSIPVQHSAAPIELFVTADQILTTQPQPRGGQVRSLPTPQGVAPRRVWALQIGADLPERIALLLGAADSTPREVTTRGLVVAELLATAKECCAGLLLPVPRFSRTTRDLPGTRWAWEIAPDAAQSARLERAVEAVLAAGAVLGPDPRDTLWQFVAALARAVTPAAGLLDFGPPPGTPAGRNHVHRWAAQVRARRLGRARLAVSLTPPGDGSGWSLVPLAVKLDEPTTRPPVPQADPALFGATEEQWQAWWAVEAEEAARAWGRRQQAVRSLVLSGDSAALDPGQVLEFLDEIAPKLAAAGFDVLAPDGLLRRAAVRRRVRATATGSGTLSADRLGLAADVLVDGEALSEEEFQALAAAKGELVSIRGRWVRVEASTAAQLRALAARLAAPATTADLLVDEAFDGVELADGEVLPAGLRPARPAAEPPGVMATMRPYQLAGLAWLQWLSDNQIGGVLADDMGLGKTLQVLAWIATDRAGAADDASVADDHADRDDHVDGRPAGPTLVVCPVTLVDTWLRQAAQFTPGLRVIAQHGGARGAVAHAAAANDIVVTTYGILARDRELAQVHWRRVVLDEAQAIKNPDTQAARAARALRAQMRLAVTGTPVENHVGDLWSLLAFAQPGLLPRRKQFEKRYVGGSPADLGRLRAVVAPFVLRRAKTDPGILPDLPDREIIRADATMTREQVGAYEAVVADMMGTLESLRAQSAGRPVEPAGTPSDPANAAQLSRRAAVLGSITRLKQICVHPALLTESRTELAGRSGKVDLLGELCAEIIDEGQAVVVFTQFASFVPELAEHLRTTLGVAVATLTGSDSRTKRAATVAQFSAADGPPILIASLKAGGTGLTLVRANHVIHLDRWWNPAVEDQASDRVWRIGQHRKVSVHVLVCPGTLEERIDAALAHKRAVAGAIVRSTDTAITELSDSDLAELVGLVRDRVLQ